MASPGRIVIIGGTGLIGTRVATRLRAAGVEVLQASPASGVDALTGEGLDAALDGAAAVIEVTNPASLEPVAALDFFRTTARNLAQAGRRAGVGHHLALSIVGVDRMPDNGYFAAKLAQEQGLRESGLPWTVLRATQFMEFIGAIADAAEVDGIVRLSGGQFQPIAADDVAEALARAALSPPVSGILEIAGPERAPLDEFARRRLALAGDPRRVLRDPEARYFGARVEERSLTPLGPAWLGRIDLDAWAAGLAPPLSLPRTA
ncbi:SDR family oxidoreductase [uncultured Albimonas sp.]|mgnify:CR=1 FL=1|uniref:SDR family oxidoreductase n=1 Tax=uncultured Albimonas sp. TaxID=1331701 RepID=UPI0030EE899D